MAAYVNAAVFYHLQILSALLLLLLAASPFGWPRALLGTVGGIFVGLRRWALFFASAFFMGAAWSVMLTLSAQASVQSNLLPGTRIWSGVRALVDRPWLMLWVFTALGLSGLVSVVWWRDRRLGLLSASIRAAAGAVAAWLTAHALALPAVCAAGSGTWVPFPSPLWPVLTGGRVAGWALGLYRWVSLDLTHWPVLHWFIRSFLYRADGMLRIQHYFALTSAALFFVLLLLVGLLFRPDRRPLPAVAYLMILVTVLIWFLPGIAVWSGPILPLWAFLVVLLILGYTIGRTRDHYYAVDLATGSERAPRTLTPADVVRASRDPEVLVVMCVSGGGIQAAGWITWVMTRLVAACPRMAQALRLISGVSGGSVGTAFLLNQLASRPGLEAADAADVYDTAFQQSVTSSLGPTVYGLIYTDLIRYLSGGLAAWKLWDRGELLQRAWQRNAGAPHALSFGDLVDSILSGAAPAPILNTTSMETGDRIMATPLVFKPRQSELPRACTLAEVFTDSGPTDVSIWTAARLSATFPFVSPACRGLLVDPATGRPTPAQPTRGLSADHLIDGGYFDNFGVPSALDFLEEVLRDDEPVPFKRLAIVELRAFNDSKATAAAPGWVAALLGPIKGILAARTTTQHSRNEAAMVRFIGQWQQKVKT